MSYYQIMTYRKLVVEIWRILKISNRSLQPSFSFSFSFFFINNSTPPLLENQTSLSLRAWLPPLAPRPQNLSQCRADWRGSKKNRNKIDDFWSLLDHFWDWTSSPTSNSALNLNILTSTISYPLDLSFLLAVDFTKPELSDLRFLPWKSLSLSHLTFPLVSITFQSARAKILKKSHLDPSGCMPEESKGSWKNRL